MDEGSNDSGRDSGDIANVVWSFSNSLLVGNLILTSSSMMVPIIFLTSPNVMFSNLPGLSAVQRVLFLLINST